MLDVMSYGWSVSFPSGHATADQKNPDSSELHVTAYPYQGKT